MRRFRRIRSCEKIAPPFRSFRLACGPMHSEAAESYDTADGLVDSSPAARIASNRSGRQRLVIRIAYRRDDLHEPARLVSLPLGLPAIRAGILVIVTLTALLGSALLAFLWPSDGGVPVRPTQIAIHGLFPISSATEGQRQAASQSAARSASALRENTAPVDNKPQRSAKPAAIDSPSSTGVRSSSRPTPHHADMVQALSEKQDLLHSIRLLHFDWRPDARDGLLLLDVNLRNTGSRRIDKIELVCTQYAKDLTLLETTKIPLQGPVEPALAKSFKSIVGGLMNRATRRVQCLIADASAASDTALAGD